MRWSEYPDKRHYIKRGFLIRPRCLPINGRLAGLKQWRWLEFAVWERVFETNYRLGIGWHDSHWIDNPNG